MYIEPWLEKRTVKLIKQIIQTLSLDLSGIGVLTEAASGCYAVTPIIAAMAGARVYAVCQDSGYAKKEEVKSFFEQVTEALDLKNNLFLVDDKYQCAHETSLVTNLGFVRPIDRRLIESLPSDAAISLMWEPWELRKEDIDLDACKHRDVPIIGTNEHSEKINIFSYLGLLVIKLLFEMNIEVQHSKLLLISSTPFLSYIYQSLHINGAETLCVSLDEVCCLSETQAKDLVKDIDCVVFADHNQKSSSLSENSENFLSALQDFDVPILHLCGKVSDEVLSAYEISKFPKKKVRPGFMSYTLAYLGPKPVIELHGLGLKLGEVIVRQRRNKASMTHAIQAAIETGYGMEVELL